MDKPAERPEKRAAAESTETQLVKVAVDSIPVKIPKSVIGEMYNEDPAKTTIWILGSTTCILGLAAGSYWFRTKFLQLAVKELKIDLKDELVKIGSKFAGLENKVGGLENKFGGLENKFGGLENKVDEITFLVKKFMQSQESK